MASKQIFAVLFVCMFIMSTCEGGWLSNDQSYKNCMEKECMPQCMSNKGPSVNKESCTKACNETCDQGLKAR
ncbi:hypothetical protein ACHQM5_019378 [Ranunculus cassubicifolius]